MSTQHQLTVEAHYRQTARLVEASQRALEQAEQTGSVRDFLSAVEVAAKVQDFAGKELVRYRVRKTLVEAAGVLAGEYDGQENVELGSWSDGASADAVPARAAEVLNKHAGLY